MLETTIMISLLNATVLLVFKKWKWLDLYSAYRRRWMPSPDCYLCLSFWLSWVEIGSGFLIQSLPPSHIGQILAAMMPNLSNTAVFWIPWCSCCLSAYLVNKSLLIDL